MSIVFVSFFVIEKFNVLYEMNWTSAVEKELREFESKVVATAKNAGYSDNVKEDLHWTFSGALLYSVSIITTIGKCDMNYDFDCIKNIIKILMTY